MNMKKILSLLLALVLVLGMTACAAQNDPETTPAATVPETTAPAETESASLSKIVVYNSSLCTVLEAFGKTDTIVGAYGSLSEKYGVPECGKWNEVDVEAVIATGAEAIFGYAKYTTEEQISKLKEADIECYVSLEERMGCGIGACLACACKTKDASGEHYKHVCKDGPVFSSKEVEF